ncbi:MAG: argininosuccinate synthase [Candidatus Odinarchaeota archaeon]
MKGKKCLLLYSGGLDTSCMLKWLQDEYGYDVYTLIVNLGQEEKDWSEVERKALNLGVKKHFTVDAQEEFAERYVSYSIKANSLYQGAYPLSTAIGRPLIAKIAVEVANREGINVIAHGCTGKGNDNVRLGIGIKTLAPNIEVLTPVITWGISRSDSIKYAEKHGIPVPVTVKTPYSVDENLWGRSIECGILEDPYSEPKEDGWQMTVNPEKAPAKPEYVEIEFEKGIPVSVNGKKMSLVELIKYLNKVAGGHGVGRIDHMEDRVTGIKSRETYECPAAITIITAHKDLEKSVSTFQELHFKELVDERWTYLAYAGLWFDPLREALEAFIDKINLRVNGVVRLKLYKGHCQVVGRKSDWMLYDKNIATYEEGSIFDQKSSLGYINIMLQQSQLFHKILKKHLT